ncbi:MAG: hypothetical protein AB3N20_14520 [Rhizobiaceae bacterium]
MGDQVFSPFVDQYLLLHSEINKAIMHDDQQAITELDRRMVELFDQILQHQPTSKLELIELCKFLMAEMVRFDESSPNRERICVRIVSLIDAFVPDNSLETRDA